MRVTVSFRVIHGSPVFYASRNVSRPGAGHFEKSLDASGRSSAVISFNRESDGPLNTTFYVSAYASQQATFEVQYTLTRREIQKVEVVPTPTNKTEKPVKTEPKKEQKKSNRVVSPWGLNNPYHEETI